MTAAEVNTLLKSGEGKHIEFKEAQNGVPVSLYESIVSFSNTEGGVVLLGVNDDGAILGLTSGQTIDYTKLISSTINNPDCIQPALFYEPQILNTKAGDILAIQIPAASQVHRYKNRIYIRESDNDLDITDQEQKVSNLYFHKKQFFTENAIYPALSMDDLSEELFQKARKIIKSQRSDHPWLLEDDETILRHSVLYRKDFSTGQEGLTLAAALIFGKDTTIQQLLPAYKVEAIVRKENKDRWDDRLTLRTNLIDTYLELKQFINKHLPTQFYIEGDQRVDLRDTIFREVIGNMVVHREYTSHRSSDLIIENDKVQIINPNKALFHGPLNPETFNPYPKNPNIRKFFTAFGWTDEIGSGVKNTFKYLPIYADGARPFFWEDELFRTELPLVNKTLKNFNTSLIQWLALPAEVTEHTAEGLKQVQLSMPNGYYEWPAVLLHLVPSWNQEGIRHEPLNWPANQPMAEHE